MANIAWRVKFGSAAATPAGGTILNDVQSVSVQAGREWLTDPYNPSSCIIQSRNIAAWTTAPKIGDMIAVQQTNSTSKFAFGGFIKDVQINYGMVASMDTATITCEGPLALWGRRQFNSLVVAQNNTVNQIDAVANPTSLYNYTNPNTNNGLSIASGQTYTGNGLDLLNEACQTEVGHIAEVTGVTFWITVNTYAPFINFLRRNDDVTANYTFSDNPASASEMYYDAIEFTSAAQNYYTAATIQPLGLASQSAGSGDYSITQSSLDYTTTQAASHAQYLVSQFKSTASTPFAISAAYSNQGSNATRLTQFANFMHDGASSSGQLIKIVFRTNTYYAVIEGAERIIDLSDTIINLTLSAQDNNNYLILNNAVFGTLGTSGTYPGNKLGF